MNDPLHEIPPSVPTKSEGYGKPDAFNPSVYRRTGWTDKTCPTCGRQGRGIPEYRDQGIYYCPSCDLKFCAMGLYEEQNREDKRKADELIERIDASKYPEQIALLHRQLKEEKAAHSEEEQKLEKRIEELSKEVRESTLPAAWLFALMIAASAIVLAGVATLTVWACGKVIGYFQ